MNAWHRFIEYWKSNWFIRAITIIIIIFSLGMLAYIIQELDFLKGSAWNKAAWEIYEFLDEWAMIISAGVTIMLAITVGWVIMDNYRDRKVDRIQRLQNDVISWATEVMKALFVTSFKRQTVVQENMREKLTVLTAVKIFTKTKAAELMPDGELARKVENAGTHLEQFIKNLEHTSENDFVSLETPCKNLKQEFLDIIESASSIVIPEFK